MLLPRLLGKAVLPHILASFLLRLGQAQSPMFWKCPVHIQLKHSLEKAPKIGTGGDEGKA